VINPLGCALLGLLVAGAACLAACLARLAKRRALDTALVARAVDRIGQGRCDDLPDGVRVDAGWTGRLIARAAARAAGKPAEMAKALPEVVAADFARLQALIARLRTIGVAGVAAGIFYILSRSPGAARASVTAAQAPLDPAVIALVAMLALLAVVRPLRNRATLLALRARQAIGVVLARARGPAKPEPVSR
jgi:hypothetical protein